MSDRDRRLSQSHLNAIATGDIPSLRNSNPRRTPPSVNGALSYSTPTKERQRKALNDWETKPHPGGQVSYREKSTIDTFREHLDQGLIDAGARFCMDVEALDRSGVICSRSYTGMPFAEGRHDLSDSVCMSAGFIRWFHDTVDQRFIAAVSWLVLGIKPNSLNGRSWAEATSAFRDPTTKSAYTAGSLKMVLIRIDEARRAYAAHLRSKATACGSHA